MTKRTLVYLIALMFLLPFAPAEAAETHSISGITSDFETGKVLANVRVEAYSCKGEFPAGKTTSASDGSYELPLESGCYTLRYKADGYESSWYGDPPVRPKRDFVYLDDEPVSGIDVTLSSATSYITGRVVDAQGKPLEGAWAVALMNEENAFSITDGRTDEGGQFVIETMTGRYAVFFEMRGHASTIYGDSWSDPVKLDVGLGEVMTNIDATMGPGGSISGLVRDSAGQGLDGITVYLQGGEFPIGWRTGRNGDYVIDGVPAGNYTVYFIDEGRVYQPQYYNGTQDPREAKAVEVVSALETTGVNATLSEAGRISGSVFDADGNGVPNVTVVASSTSNRAMTGYAVTDEAGRYMVPGLASGEYFVMFTSTDSLFQFLFYPGVSTPTDAERVAVSAPEETGGIDLALGQGLTLSGTVRGPDNEPLEGAFVAVNPVEGKASIAGYGVTDKKGQYTIVVQPGEYLVRFGNVKGYLDQWSGGVSEEKDAETLLVTDGSLTLDMVLPRGGSISGTVGNRAGAPLAGITVKAYDKASGKRKGTATSDEKGLYRIEGLTSGSFTVVASGEESGYVKQTYAQPVEVAAPKETPRINLVLSAGGGFAGRVSDERGQPLKGVDVEIFEPVTWREIADTETDENGEYAIGGLPVGSYGIRFEKNDHIVQWYAGKTRREDAERVDVVDTAIRPGYDVSLKKGVSLSGVVTDSGGVPVSYVEVGLYADIDDEPIEEIHTGYDGRYTFKSLAPGSYRVRFGTEDHIPKWYGGAHRREAGSIDISNAGISDLNISLELSTDKVAGKMVNEAGEKVGQAWMTVIDAETNRPVSDERICECSGKFKLPLLPGRYKLLVERFGKQYWYGGDSFETAQVFDVNGEVKGLEMLIQ